MRVADRVDILLVDDQTANLDALEALLERLGQNLYRAESGGEALRLLLERDFALILLDVKMPVLDGFETARLIRERDRSSRIPIIFLTGINEGQLPLSEAYSLGAVDYLIKPFEAEFLRSKVSVFVDLALKTQQIQQTADALRDAERQEHEREMLRRQMEAGLAQRRWLEAILNVMPTPLVLVDPAQPRVIFANRASHGVADGAFTHLGPIDPGLKFSDGEGASVAWHDLPMQRILRGERLAGRLVEFEGPREAGAMLAYSERLGAMFGHPETVLLALDDVGELKRAEADLRAAVRAREDFVAVGSHELRTPLTALKLQISNALRAWVRPDGAPPPIEALASHLHRMQRSIERLERLSEFLLDVSRISGGVLHLDRTRVDLGELAQEVAARFDTELAQARCTLRVTAAPTFGEWDRGRVDQAISNLIVNAIKYAPGGPIDVAVAAEDGIATLVVRDRGPGIPPELQGRLFDRFERAARPEEGGGFGLGLWLVREIVRLHGGTVSVQSRVGEGAAFTIALPCEPPVSSTAMARA